MLKYILNDLFSVILYLNLYYVLLCALPCVDKQHEKNVAENLYLFNVIIYIIIIIAALCLHTETNFIQPVNKLKASVIVFSQIIFAKTLQWLIVRFRPRFLSALWVVRQS